ncbi:MAG: 3-deoxy-7-phosphoheptulonate synthase [Phycisphaera sp.]|nr:3-deoxy-7-phosphoheptulonate synthase [Phycisphaera sp.]
MPQSTHKPLQDLRVAETIPLMSPADLVAQMPLTPEAARTVEQGRDEVTRILTGQDDRLLAVVGPCSIHDPKAAMEYAGRLAKVRKEVEKTILVVMRVYFEKPRTTVGWKGLINDPHLDGSLDIATGLRMARRLLLDINAMGLPAGTEMLDPITPQYIADLIAWSAIGARTTESQTHRQMASGLSMPVGFKNATSGEVDIAVHAMLSARGQHSFLGIDNDGKSCIIRTTGNPTGHLILRGGAGNKPNYDPENVASACAMLRKAGLPDLLMVDCSHANAAKKFERQEIVWNHVIDQRATGEKSIIGMMVESNLEEGNQSLDDPRKLKYGVSVTDPCIGWAKTEQLLHDAAKRLAK